MEEQLQQNLMREMKEINMQVEVDEQDEDEDGGHGGRGAKTENVEIRSDLMEEEEDLDGYSVMEREMLRIEKVGNDITMFEALAAKDEDTGSKDIKL